MEINSPHGTWNSPITVESVTAAQKRFTNIVIDGNDIYWDEMRPNEGGRTIIVKHTPDGKTVDMTPVNYSARSRVHEYGGAPFTVHNGEIFWVGDKDQRIYRGSAGLTEPGTRFADLKVAGPYLLAIGEKGHDNFIAAVDLKNGRYERIAEGHDFYASLALSPDGKKLAYLTWEHPQMPWDGTELWVADYENGKLKNGKVVAGGKSESVFQPQWAPDGTLYFVSDKTGWWNLYRLKGSGMEPLCPMEAEFGLPQWIFGMSTYAFTDDKIVAAYQKDGHWSLATLPPLANMNVPGTFFTQIRAGKGFAVFITGSSTEAKSVVRLDLASHKTEILAHNAKPHIDPRYFSVPEFISYPSAKGRTAHGFFYPPANKDYQAPKGTLPPLIVMIHGGPTACTDDTFDLEMQYWTSRGFAVLDVDYGGSTGYGRAYRDLLKDNWGIVDVEDCEYGARYLIAQKKVDPKKIAITGGSAGGYTTLAALAFGKTFTVGASHYGVSDLEALATETHKFESRYLDGLVAPYPEGKAVYEARSPLFAVDRLHCPIIFFQGSEDKVVPPNQAEKMHEALKNRGIATDLVIYEGEQHGFRKAENIRDCLQKELNFYLKVWELKD
jgi:dipeptidyl aminopeptidase/acylaminoacyl peptidase